MTTISLTKIPDTADFTEIQPIIDSIREICRNKNQCIISIDGMCASGKTTVAELFSKIFGVSVIHMDDFFLPPEKRTEERLNEAGGNVDYERFYSEVILHLSDKILEYGKFDCSVMKISEKITVSKTDIVLIEGSYSHHPFFGDYSDVKIFIETESSKQLERILIRNGEEKLAMFKSRWIPMEMKYFNELNISDKCDFLIKT